MLMTETEQVSLSDKIRIDISVPGTFHAFHLGKQLHDRGVLRTIYTSYPRYKLNIDESIEDHVSSIWYSELIAQLCEWTPGMRRILSPTYLKGRIFDHSVARKLNSVNTGLLIGFAGSALRSIRKANNLGMTTVTERSSTHIRKQAAILNEEFARFSKNGTPPIQSREIKYQETEYTESDYIFVPSTFVERSLINEGIPEESIKRVPLGVDIARYQPPSDPAGHRDTDSFYFLYAGAVSLQKGIPYLLQAWNRLDSPDAELLIAGSVTPDCRDIVLQYDSDPTVHILGWVDNVERLYQKASALVFPSLQDGFGMAVTEAMASGCPVIVTEHTGAKDCVEENETGYIVPIRDPEVLADRMSQLYANRAKRQSMGTAAYDTVKNEYTWADYGRRVYRAYQNIVTD